MMEFRVMAGAVRDLLGAQSKGEYRVIGYETFPQDVARYVGKNRTARVFYSAGKFPVRTIRAQEHEFTLSVELCVVADAETDLDTLQDEEATQEALQNAMASIRPSADVVNEQFDELIDLIYNVLSDPANIWLGLEKYRLKGMGVVGIKKDRLLPYGDHAVLTGTMDLAMTVTEKPKSSITPTLRTQDTVSIEGKGE